MSVEQNVAEAARAVVSPHTDPQTRASASQFLEEWTKTDGAWEIYAVWLQHQLDGMTNADDIQIGMQLLSMQLLQSKIRRDIPRGTTPIGVLERIYHCLARLLTTAANLNSNHVALQPASICYAALSVRCGGLSHVISQATVDPASATASTDAMPPPVTLRILSNVPLEVAACSDLTTSRVTEELLPYLERILESCCKYILHSSNESAALATEAIERWTQYCHVSLSQLNTPIGEQQTVVLPVLVHLLSQSHYSDEQLPVKASKSLVEAILVPSDACSDSRRIACEALLSAISSSGFITAPLQFATSQGWEDTCHALANVICTLVTEEVDYCVTQPMEAVLSLLLQLQSHPQMKVGCLVLECWLTVQEVPTGQRHGNWKAPLFAKVIEVLVNRMAYPVHFVNWEEELDVDESEFQEFRRMVKDVLISGYFLLRGNFVKSMAQTLQPQQQAVPWNVQEAALFALTVSAREVCGRMKARGGGTSVGRDREETSQTILSLAQSLCGTDQALAVQEMGRRHWLVLAGACDWFNAYAAIWGAKCSAESIFQILKFLCIPLNLDPTISQPASKALKSVMVGCAPKLSESGVEQGVLMCIKEAMDTALTKQDEATMFSVAEGCTRLAVQLSDDLAVQTAISALISPLIHQCGAALKVLPESPSKGFSEQQSDALDALEKYLSILHVIVRFCERREGQSAAKLMNLIWPFLESASQVLLPYEDARKKMILIHEQLLKNMPALAATRFEATVKYVVRIIESSNDPNALGYIESAVETFGPSGQFDFDQLLCHVFAVLSPTFSSKPLAESNDLVAAFYQLCGRYLIYTPANLAQSAVLADVVALAVVCIKECKGQREATIESLNFLSRVYNWRGLPLPDESKLALQQSMQSLDEVLSRNGNLLVQSCIEVLVGGSQILWPASSDCLFSVVLWSLACYATASGMQKSDIARQWLEAVQTPDQAVYQQVVKLLLNLAKNGTKGRVKAKLLLSDFVMLLKGEASPDILLSYAL